MENTILFLVIFTIITILSFFLAVWIVKANKAIRLNEITIKNRKIPKSFSGYRIVQVTDLHNDEFGENNINLINKVKEGRPDIIVITGDFIDSRFTNIDVSVKVARHFVKIAPTYYIAGNHESRLAEYPPFKEELVAMGITVLDNEQIKLEKNNEYINLSGVTDIAFNEEYQTDEDDFKALKQHLSQIEFDSSAYTILLSHRPEFIDIYASTRVDLILSGHTHGGQACLPFIGGIFAPGQGFFPKYDSGVFNISDETTMIIGKGLGRSLFPYRVNNNPEVIVVKLLADWYEAEFSIK